jgi:hypothetical protein
VITDPIEINQRFVKLPEVVVLGIDDPEDGPFRARIESARTPQGCPLCGVLAHVKDREVVELVDPPPAATGRASWVTLMEIPQSRSSKFPTP